MTSGDSEQSSRIWPAALDMSEKATYTQDMEMERAAKEQDARMLKRLEEMWGEFVRYERAM
jgi:hypothetical protein